MPAWFLCVVCKSAQHAFTNHILFFPLLSAVDYHREGYHKDGYDASGYDKYGECRLIAKKQFASPSRAPRPVHSNLDDCSELQPEIHTARICLHAWLKPPAEQHTFLTPCAVLLCCGQCIPGYDKYGKNSYGYDRYGYDNYGELLLLSLSHLAGVYNVAVTARSI